MRLAMLVPTGLFLRVRALVAVAGLASVALTCAACASEGDPNAAAGAAANGNQNGTGNGNNTTTGVACAPGSQLECKPEIRVNEKTGAEVKSGKAIAVNAGDIAVGQTRSFEFRISNAGNHPLTVSRVDLTYVGKAGEAEPAFTCVVVGPDATTACKEFKFPVINPAKAEGTTVVAFEVRFKKLDEDKRTAVLTIQSDDKSSNKAANMTVTFGTETGLPKLKLAPSELDFGFVALDKEKVVAVKMLNVGNADLVVTAIDLTGLDAKLFTAIVEGKEYATGAVATLDPAVVIKPGASVDLKLLYKGKDDKPHNGELYLQTNDPSVNEGGSGKKRASVKVNSTGPCLIVEPKHVAFGATAVGQAKKQKVTLKSCGDQAVEVNAIELDADGNKNFVLSWVGAAGGKPPTASAPLIVPVNGDAKLELTYSPDKLSPLVAGQPKADKSGLTIRSNTVLGESKVTMEGVGSSGDCPTGIITVLEGDTVVPQTMLHLDGKQSYANGGATIGTYEWEVTQPTGSVALFQPNAKKQSVQFQPNVAGKYTFRLHVTDQTGKKSCFPAEKLVEVLPDQAMHVELLWKTPGDKDETNEGPGAGSDLDLHVTHQFASGQDYDKDGVPDPWFAATYDCFWYNKNPEWGSYDPNIDDNPSLDRDDTDGAGPENLNLTLPEDGRKYAIGVHYFNDFGLGASQATVRVFVYGDLQFELTSTNLIKGDLWYVATVDWPSGVISGKKDKNNKFFITAKYPAPEL